MRITKEKCIYKLERFETSEYLTPKSFDRPECKVDKHIDRVLFAKVLGRRFDYVILCKVLTTESSRI